MIEQGIYFALGCIITALLALMFAPVFWRRALRLTRQRLQLQVPVSMQEILAERDQIRADFAVERVRIERAMEGVQATKTADMAEIGRRSMECVALSDQVATLTAVEKGQDAEIGRLSRESVETEAENAALRLALYDSEHGIERWRERAEAAQAKAAGVQAEAESNRATVAALKTRSMGLEMRLSDAERSRVAREKAADENLKARLETAMAHVARHEAAGVSMRRELDDAKMHVRRVEGELEAARADIEAVRERERVVSLSRGLQSEKGRGADRSLGERLELLQAENAALQGALAAARRVTSAASDADGADDADLRNTIHALGIAVAKLGRQRREADRADESMAPRVVEDETSHPLGVA